MMTQNQKIELFTECANINAIRKDDGYVFCWRLQDWQDPVKCTCQTTVQASQEW